MRNLFTILVWLIVAGCSKPVTFDRPGENPEIRHSIDEEYLLCEFPAPWTGLQEWRTYLENNLQPDSILLATIPDGTYKGIIRFEADGNGVITNVSIEKDPGYGLGEMACHVIQQYKANSLTAGQRIIRNFYCQPVTFIIGE